MAGVVVFKSLSEALRAGYQVYERTNSGYLVRMRTANGWAMAVVTLVLAGMALRLLLSPSQSLQPVSILLETSRGSELQRLPRPWRCSRRRPRFGSSMPPSS